MSKRNMLELSYLAHVRECALGSIKAFLTFNGRLLTVDITRRLSGMLEYSVAFLKTLPEKRMSDDPINRLSPALQLHDYEVMVRRRVFQCFAQLLESSPAGSLEATSHSTILSLAIATFSEPEGYAPSSLSQAIISSAASFEDLWELGDQFGFGVSSLAVRLNVIDPVDGEEIRHWTSLPGPEADIDQAITTPICPSAEYDGMSCYLVNEREETLPSPSPTEVVNAAVHCFGLSLPLQDQRIQNSTLEQVTANLTAPILQKDPARKAAITVNIALSLWIACRVAVGETRAAKGDLRRSGTEKGLQALLHVCLKDDDETARHIAAETLGRLCSANGNALTTSEITYLTETVVNNREPQVRAGCAMGLANIHSKLGGMAAGFHMKTIVGILMSLAADPHPLVHFWAIDSLAQVADSAGLNFSGYVTNALGMVCQLYATDTHSAETAAQASSNIAMHLPASAAAAIARAVDAITNVLGPDLQDMSKARDMIMIILRQVADEDDTAVHLENLRCLEHLSLYAPEQFSFEDYVERLQTDVHDPRTPVRDLALQGLFTIMRRDATEVLSVARPGLEEQLWECLSSSPGQKHARGIFRNWLQQTGPGDPSAWIQRTNSILTKTKSKTLDHPASATLEVSTATDLQDEEVAGFASAAGVSKDENSSVPSSTQELMRWQVRLFAMECLHDLISMIAKEAGINAQSSFSAMELQRNVGEVIRIAFSASTAGVTGLRVIGLKIVNQILQMFGKTADPDFPEAMLLEQYQAQIFFGSHTSFCS